MTPESLMPALRNGVAGFLIAITSIVTPLTAVFNEPRTSTFREAPTSRNVVEDSSRLAQRRVRSLYCTTHSADNQADTLHFHNEAHAC